MDAMSFISEIRKRKIPVITVGNASRITGKGKEYSSLFLHRLRKRGALKKVENGKYALPDANQYALASNLATPSYISLMTAYSIHGLTSQMPLETQVLTTHNKKPLEYEGITIRFIRTRPYMMYGIERTGGVAVAEKEKAVADSLRMPEYSPLEETYNALLEGRMDAEKLVEYARKTRSQAALKRLGYLLEKTGVDESAGIGRLSSSYAPLNPLLPQKGTRNKKWRLIVNEAL